MVLVLLVAIPLLVHTTKVGSVGNAGSHYEMLESCKMVCDTTAQPGQELTAVSPPPQDYSGKKIRSGLRGPPRDSRTPRSTRTPWRARQTRTTRSTRPRPRWLFPLSLLS
ncbi:hypothetical protein NQD34_005483 [Periophthalmus magnuspinnatus]|nr:hypothetical protein NQD34_005483 [Periophthalmus magnuspinnatus]